MAKASQDKPAQKTGLSLRGKAVALSASTWVVAGLGSGTPIVTALGVIMGTLLLSGYLVARLTQLRLARGGCKLRLKGRVAETMRASVGQPIPLEVEILTGQRLKLSPHGLRPQTVNGLKCDVVNGDTISLKLVPQRIGDCYLQGFEVNASYFASLFELAFWCPLRIRVQAMPRLFTTNKNLPVRTARAAAREQASAMAARRRGFGLELRELRDYQSGDSFKHIAWRATARRGKVVCREFESDLSVSAWVALDVSPSMFWGAPGNARIDYAMETTYGILSMMGKLGQPCGLSLFDTEVRHVVPRGTGRAHLRRATNALLEVSSLLHEERTELSNMELVQRVSQWFQAQEGLNFQVADVPYADASSLDLARLASAARRKLYEYINDECDGRTVVPVDAYAHDPNQSLFRAFARYAGISLPLDPSPRPGGQSFGLASVLEGVLERPGGPHTVLVISDLHTATDLELIRRAAMAMRRQRHGLVVFCPSHPSFDGHEGGPEAELQAALGHTANMATQHRLREVKAALHPAGVSFLHCGPRDVLGRLLDRLRRVA